jgi:hypothetical protein
MRKLASIERITKLTPIENADEIETASVKGWKSVVRKGDFKEGELIVFCEIDSVLPEKPEFEFLRQRKFRIRTIKLKGAISQGICFPLSILPEGTKIVKEAKIIEGADVTDILGVEQYIYQIPAQLQGMIKGAFPSFLSKTDEPRIQIIQDVLKRHKGTKCVITEKVDGCLHYRQRIKTDKGEIEIGRIVNQKMPLKILTYDEKNKYCEYKSITHYHKYSMKNKKWIRIGIGCRGKGNREKYVDCTTNHHFLSNKGWIKAQDLRIGDIVYHYVDTLEAELQELILGTLLGDGSIYSTHKNYKTICFNQSTKQKDYFEYKTKLFGKLFIPQKSQKSGYGSIMLRGLLKSNLSILNLTKICCDKKGKKTINKEWLDRLSPLSLAFWYMDDGSIFSRDERLQKPRCRMNTQGFSLKENKLLKEMLKNKFDIEVSIGKKEIYKGYILLFNRKNTEKFCSLIAPYICKSMKYKLPKRFEEWKCCLEKVTFGTRKSIIPTKILNKKNLKEDLYSNSCYDLTIKDNHNYFTHSILTHNSSCTFYHRNGEFGVCSRNLELKESPENTLWKLAKELLIEEKMRQMGKNIALQGEIIGNGIQKNPLRLPTTKILFFNVFDIDNYKYLDFVDFKRTLDELELESVPIIDTNYTLIDDIDELVKLSIANSKLNPKVYREGIVIRSLIEKMDMQMAQNQGNGRLSFKVTNPLYLLKFDA